MNKIEQSANHIMERVSRRIDKMMVGYTNLPVGVRFVIATTVIILCYLLFRQGNCLTEAEGDWSRCLMF